MRIFVRLLSIVLALAVASGGLLGALEVAWHWWRPDSQLLIPWPSWRAELTRLHWDSPIARTTAAILAAAGLLVVLASLVARNRAIKFAEPDDGVSVATSPHSLARMVGQRVRAQENVTGASITASSRAIRVRATSALATEAELRPQLKETVSELLQELPLQKKPKVSVIVESPKDQS